MTEIKAQPPGCLLRVKGGVVEELRFADGSKPRHCFFEWVYFANVASSLDGASVYQARANLGRALAEIEEVKVNPREHIVVPVPDTSKAAGDAFATSRRAKVLAARGRRSLRGLPKRAARTSPVGAFVFVGFDQFRIIKNHSGTRSEQGPRPLQVYDTALHPALFAQPKNLRRDLGAY